MDYEKTLCKCSNIGDLVFLIDNKPETGIGDVSFTVTQRVRVENTTSGRVEVPLLRSIWGAIYPKDDKSVGLLLEHTIAGENSLITVHGPFRDEITSEAADYTLEGVLLQVDRGSWSFHANRVKRS